MKTPEELTPLAQKALKIFNSINESDQSLAIALLKDIAKMSRSKHPTQYEVAESEFDDDDDYEDEEELTFGWNNPKLYLD